MRTALLSSLLGATLGLSAQPTVVKPFPASPPASVSQGLGISSVKIDYSSPGVKGRKIWGGLVPFGQVWRAGANGATSITFSDPVRIGGKELAPGSYAFFAIPGPGSWTLILNKDSKQWGAYSYKAENDVVRLEAIPVALPAPQEHLTYALQVKGPDALRVVLAWEKLSVAFDVALDAGGAYWTYLEKTLAGAKPDEHLPFTQAARYCLDSGTHPDKAREWIDHALQVKETPNNLEVKARLLHQAGSNPEAMTVLRKAIDLGTASKAPGEYLDGLKATLGAWGGK